LLEGCLGGATFTFDKAATFAVTGADVEATLDGVRVPMYTAMKAREGAELAITRLLLGAVWYLAVRGGIDVPEVLGSRSTLVSAGIGGLNGEPIRAGATLSLCGTPATRHAPPNRRGPVPDQLRASLDDTPIPLTPATRSDALTESEWQEFFGNTYTVSHAISRVGYRLDGPALPARLPADLASEPACAGAMQLPPEGQPIVLMADHPTVGGYPMIGVVPGYAIGQLAQRAPGTDAIFRRETAVNALRELDELRALLTLWLAEG
jgi:biotin-dependent carboxylase-like uncharacterized protein